MIVVDASALIAVFENEPERQQFSSIIANADRRLVSTVTLLEAGMVARGRRGAAGLAAMCRSISSQSFHKAENAGHVKRSKCGPCEEINVKRSMRRAQSVVCKALSAPGQRQDMTTGAVRSE